MQYEKNYIYDFSSNIYKNNSIIRNNMIFMTYDE